MSRTLLTAPRVITCDAARASARDPLGVIEDGAVLLHDGQILDVGPRRELLDRCRDAHVIEGPGVITPGLVDAHTHAPWMGSRAEEYALRMEGAGYEAIAAAGGGIVASMRAVRSASIEDVARALRDRLVRMAAMGVTTVECKSGYGLDETNERKQLEAVAECARDDALPRIIPTYLALHALPPEHKADRAAYVDRVRSSWLPAIAASGLARWVDAYVDRSAFSVEEARPVLLRARELGLGVRVHAGQLADVGAVEMAAELGAASADHLENVGPRGIEALARAGVTAVLLPVASYTLGQAPPPVAAMREAGVAMAVASDANPGTAPTESLPLALAFAVRSYGLSVAEAILGATTIAARSLGIGRETGSICAGLAADVVRWDVPHEAAIIQPWGVSKVIEVRRAGAVIASPRLSRA